MLLSIIKITRGSRYAFLLFVFCIAKNLQAQFTPVAITGFNHDVVAESGTSSLTNTTIPLDGILTSNRVMYTNAFKTTNGFGGGGIPDNGLITSGPDSYQLAPFTANNVLLLQKGVSGSLNIATPAAFTKIRVLAFAAEGIASVNATLHFTDNTTSTGLTNYSLADWFDGNTNLVLSGSGRCIRATPTGPAEAYPANPRFYYIEISLSCSDQKKSLQKITFSNVTVGTNAPYPNAVFWAISGKSYSQNISATINPATCSGNNGSATLNVTGTTSPYTYSWNTIPAQAGPTASNLAPGNYIATITDANSCTTTYPFVINLQNTMSMTVSKTDANCSTAGSITIAASGGSNYEYSINGGVSYQASNVFNNVAPGTYVVITRNASVPACTVSQSVTIVQQNTMSMTVSKTDANCSTAGSITVTASGGSNYEYSINGGVSYQASNVFNNLTPGTYVVITRDASFPACTVSQSVTIVQQNTMSMTVSKTDANCSTAGSITVTASGGSNYEYSINGGVSYQASNVFNNLTPGTYVVISRNALVPACTVSQTVTIAMTNNLTINNPADASICLGESLTPNISSNATSYAWTPTNGVSNPVIANPALSPAATTTYTVTATLGTCTVSRSFTVTVNSPPVINAGPDAIILAGDSYTLMGSASGGTYLWTPSAGLSSSTILNPVATPASTTVYSLQATSAQGCTATDAMTLTVVPYCVKPMAAFTPNGDGINDLWLVTNGTACITSIKAQVFNRYGAEVFQSSNYDNKWEGTYKGKPLPDGTYYYILSYKLLNGKIEKFKGNVTILR